MKSRITLTLCTFSIGLVALGASSCALETSGTYPVDTLSGSSSSGTTNGSSSSSSGNTTASSSSGMSGAGGTGGMGGMGGTGGTGGTGGAPCSGSMVLCGTTCVDTMTDSLNCGECDVACSTGTNCQAGQCLPIPVCTAGVTEACYSGDPATKDVGACKSGTRTCDLDGLGWGPCVGEILPSAEVCGNLVDEDCNGSVLSGSACLFSTDLVVRYFVDEADMGKTPTNVLDSAPTPLDLPITYVSGSNQLTYTADPMTGRGLMWAATDQGGVAKNTIDGTKIKTMLDGKTQVTMEVVAKINGSSGSYTRVFTLGASTNNQFGLGVYSTPRFSFEFNNAEASRWSADFPALGRAVLHVVVDTTDAVSANRVKLYVNGVLQTANGGTAPGANATLSLGTGNSICIGNRNTEGRSMNGVVYYAALYARALSAADVLANANALKSWDDK